jgi:hypothetical protein
VVISKPTKDDFLIENGATSLDLGRAANFLGNAVKVITIDDIMALRQTEFIIEQCSLCVA